MGKITRLINASHRGGYPFRNPPNVAFRLNKSSPQAKGLVSWWPTLGSGGDVLRDFSGIYNSTSLGGADWVTTRLRGSALQYIDTNTDRTDFGDVLDMGTSSFSISIWLMGQSGLETGTSAARVIQKRGSGAYGQYPGWLIAVRDDSGAVRIDNTGIDDGSNFFAFRDLGGNTFTIGAMETWIHLVSVFDRVKDLWTYYADGVQVAQGDISAVTGSLDNARQLTLGASDISAIQYFNGLIDEPRVYDWALSVAEARDIYNNPWELYAPEIPIFYSIPPPAPTILAPSNLPIKAFRGGWPF